MSGELPKLKLSGDKINIENRPLNKLNTASSKYLLLTNSFRSASTIPTSFHEINETVKRPFSADYRYSTQLENTLKHQSTDSLDSFQEELNSSALLKSMISEPIKMWHDHKTDKLTVDKLDEESVSKSDEEVSKVGNIDAIHDYLTLKFEADEKDQSHDKTNLKIQNWMEENQQIPNLSDLDIEALFREENEKFDKFFRNDEKFEETKTKKDFGKMPEKKINKVKFTAKPLKTASDYKDIQTPEIESWMTEKSRINGKIYVSNIVDTVNELEQTVQNCPVETVPVSETRNDLASILEVLEEEDQKSQKTVGTVEEVMAKSPQGNSNKETPLQESKKLCDLLSFLDEVDKNSSKPLCVSTVKFKGDLLKLDTVPRLEDLMSYSSKELGEFVIDLSLRVKDKSSCIVLLQTELSNLRDESMNQNKKNEQIVKQKLRIQKDEYENAIKRHQKFIDQLMNDKKSLNEKCKGLLDEMKSLENRYSSNIKAMEHKHEVELQKVKNMALAGEKIKWERWMENKTQKIKQLTAKSIEPELQNMERRQQQELADLRAIHKREIDDLELRNARKMQEQCENIRMQLTEEREKALAHERDIIRQRYEKLVETEEKGYQEQRRRLLSEHAKRIAECEEREKAVLADKEKGIKQIKEEYEEKLQIALRKQVTEINCIKDNMRLEMESWQNNLRKQQSLILNEKEMAIKEQCRKERDREIENVIERLEAESQDLKLQQEQSTENRIRRLKEKYEKEIQDLELLEKESNEKYGVLKKQLIENEDEIIGLKANIKQMQNELQEHKQITEKLQREREEVRIVIRREMEEEIDLLKRELMALKNGKDEELQQIYSRVKISMARKDEIVNDVLKDYKCLQEKCAYLENMLEQQRKQYLMK